MHITSRAVSTLLFGAAIAASTPSPASARQMMNMSECKKGYQLYSETPQEKRALKPGEPDNTPRPWTTSVNVFIQCDDSQLFADEIEYYEDTKVVKARGHVTFIDGNQRITADHLEFNTKTKLGTFYKAEGIMTVAGKPDPTSMFAPADADAYFYGEVIEKIGPDKYRLKNGTFTTCVQPTPRWEFEGSNVVLVRDKRALLRNAIFRIKNVPVFYLPWFYYPISSSGRQTGFLMPAYGHDTFRGQTFSEAFFLVLGRSMDATLNYEYASKTGSGYGGEYRYIQAPGSEGNARIKVFNGKDAADPLLATQRKDIIATMTQRLPGNWQLRGNVNYSDNVLARQLLQQDLLLNTSSTRYAGANVQGGIGKVRISGEAAITDYFNTVNGKLTAVRNGVLPQVRAEWPSGPIGKSKVYFGMAGDMSAIVRENEIGNPATDHGLIRFDTYPNLRAPIGSLPYLAMTATIGMRFTYWNEQLNAQGVQVTDPLTRRLFDARLDFIGPTFARIFDTPNLKYATRWKHVIQPTFSIARTSAFADFSKVARNDGVDDMVGGYTNLTYGLANRLLAKRPSPNGVAVAQEVASIQLQQTYYSDSSAALHDTSYQGARTVGTLSPVSAIASIRPTTNFGGQGTLEYDTKYKAIRTVSVGTSLTSRQLTATTTWSKQFFIKDLNGYNNEASLYHALSTSATFRSSNNHLSGRWGWSYDFRNKHQLQHGFVVSYMSQCCGVAAEYQTRYVGAITSTLQQNRIFNLSFSLAGIGTFSNLLGSFGR